MFSFVPPGVAAAGNFGGIPASQATECETLSHEISLRFRNGQAICAHEIRRRGNKRRQTRPRDGVAFYRLKRCQKGEKGVNGLKEKVSVNGFDIF
jgi:hypothetical protein